MHHLKKWVKISFPSSFISNNNKLPIIILNGKYNFSTTMSSGPNSLSINTSSNGLWYEIEIEKTVNYDI